MQTGVSVRGGAHSPDFIRGYLSDAPPGLKPRTGSRRPRACSPGFHPGLPMRRPSRGSKPRVLLASFPQISLVEFDVVGSQQFEQFLLIRLTTVVLFLLVDVPPHVVALRPADRERGVAILPRK